MLGQEGASRPNCSPWSSENNTPCSLSQKAYLHDVKKKGKSTSGRELHVEASPPACLRLCPSRVRKTRKWGCLPAGYNLVAVIVAGKLKVKFWSREWRWVGDEVRNTRSTWSAKCGGAPRATWETAALNAGGAVKTNRDAQLRPVENSSQ
jgi:hypothetical protein